MKFNIKLLDFINSLTIGDLSPFNIYDSDIIRQVCRALNNIEYKPESILFATMANVNHSFLKLIKEDSVKIFVNSIQDLDIVLKAGYSEMKLYLHHRLQIQTPW